MSAPRASSPPRSRGVVAWTNNQPFGTGLVTLTSGRLRAMTALTLPNGVSFANGLASIETNNVTCAFLRSAMARCSAFCTLSRANPVSSHPPTLYVTIEALWSVAMRSNASAIPVPPNVDW